MNQCPCGTDLDFDNCCGPLISGDKPAVTAEALMRSRYSAFATGNTNYLERSLHPNERSDFDSAATQRWAESSEWKNLEIINTSGGSETDDEGIVKFIATYTQKDGTHTHHEEGHFSRLKSVWYYTDAKMVTPGTQRNEGPKIGRNEPCPCGSGKKFKKCCG